MEYDRYLGCVAERGGPETERLQQPSPGRDRTGADNAPRDVQRQAVDSLLRYLGCSISLSLPSLAFLCVYMFTSERLSQDIPWAAKLPHIHVCPLPRPRVCCLGD
jgi:hypothetical protein